MATAFIKFYFLKSTHHFLSLLSNSFQTKKLKRCKEQADMRKMEEAKWLPSLPPTSSKYLSFFLTSLSFIEEMTMCVCVLGGQGMTASSSPCLTTERNTLQLHPLAAAPSTNTMHKNKN